MTNLKVELHEENSTVELEYFSQGQTLWITLTEGREIVEAHLTTEQTQQVIDFLQSTRLR